MKDLAPTITRQRLLIEGFSGIAVDEESIENYFKKITKSLNLRTYSHPIIFSPGDGENQGFDAFIPLIDSGISFYYWKKQKFLSIILYTCKFFDEKKALKITKEFFIIEKAESESF